MTLPATKTEASSTARAAAPTPTPPTTVEVTLPVYNEATSLEPAVRRLRQYLQAGFPFATRITIADNGSSDGTWPIARRLATELPDVTAYRLERNGRGRALRQVWSEQNAPVLVYMDVDLSTDLAALLPLVAPLLSGHSDLAIGTRLTRSARVVRGPKRELISRCYNLILRAALGVHFSDAQCGFKAIRAAVVPSLLPVVHDEAWFFDTELLVLAERAGLRIHEVPVDWTDDPDSRVDVVRTAWADLRGVARLTRSLAAQRIPLDHLRARFGRQPAVDRPWRQAVRFGLVGVASTLAFLGVYALLRTRWPAVLADAAALLLTATANTTVNRRFTFQVRGTSGLLRQHGQALLAFAVALALTTGSLALLHTVSPRPGRGAEFAVLTVANLVATAVRFEILRRWVFRRPTPSGVTGGHPPQASRWTGGQVGGGPLPVTSPFGPAADQRTVPSDV